MRAVMVERSVLRATPHPVLLPTGEGTQDPHASIPASPLLWGEGQGEGSLIEVIVQRHPARHPTVLDLRGEPCERLEGSAVLLRSHREDVPQRASCETAVKNGLLRMRMEQVHPSSFNCPEMDH